MITCPRCGQEQEDSVQNCSKCGLDLKLAIKNPGADRDQSEAVTIQRVKEMEGKAEKERKGQTPGKWLAVVRWGALIVSLGSVAFCASCWFLAHAAPSADAMVALSPLFVYGGVAAAMMGVTIAYLATGWRLVTDRRRLTVGRLAEILFVVGYSITLLWLALALTGAPNNTIELRLQRLIGRRDLASLNLSGFGLQGIALPKCDLHGADLSHADLREADLSGADLSEADLGEADLSRADLSRANLSEADLSGANLNGAHLGGANLRNAKLDGRTEMYAKWRLVWELATAGGEGRDLRGTDLARANLTGANLGRADLNRADLSWADLSGANLLGADLRWADLTFADLSGANLSGADLSGAYLNLTHLIYGEANLSRADLSRANLTGAIVTDSQLAQAKSLKGATMPDGSVHE